MKQREIKHIDIDKYKPIPIEDKIMSEDYDSKERQVQNIVFNDLNEVERNLLIASIELGSQSALAKELGVSCGTVSILLKKIKNKVKSKYKNGNKHNS